MEGLSIMNRFKGAALVLVTAVVAISMLSVPDQATAQGSAALSISPRKDYNVEPGKTITDTLVVRNQDRERPLNLYLRKIDFTSNDDSGAPKLLLDEDAPQLEESLRPFMTIPESVTIEPGGSASIEMTIAIPEGQGGGSYYSAVVYSTSSSEGGNVGLSASGVTLVFADVPGEVRQNLDLKKVGAYAEASGSNGEKYSNFFFEDAPKRIAYTLKNEGNVTGRPYGTITLKPLFGKEVIINDINPNNSLALRGQERIFVACTKLKSEEADFDGSRTEATTCAESGLWPGFYKVDFAAYYGRNGTETKDLNGSSWFIYAPWWFILIFVTVLAFISYHVWRIVNYINRKRSGAQFKNQSRRRK